jgi:dienelactone hydrolase
VKPQRVTILNKEKEKLVGYLYKGTSKKLIIVCHGMESNNVPLPPYTKELVSDYLAYLSHMTKASIFSFDFSGFGESEGKHILSLIKRDSEIKNVLDYFSPTYGKIFLYGTSLSGATVAIAAGKYKAVQGIITINGFFTLHPGSLYKTNVLLILSVLISNPLYIRELYFLNKHLKADKIAVPTLVIHSDKDNIVNVKQSINFFKSLYMKKKIVQISSSDHALFGEYMQVPAIVSSWLSEI